MSEDDRLVAREVSCENVLCPTRLISHTVAVGIEWHIEAH